MSVVTKKFRQSIEDLSIEEMEDMECDLIADINNIEISIEDAKNNFDDFAMEIDEKWLNRAMVARRIKRKQAVILRHKITMHERSVQYRDIKKADRALKHEITILSEQGVSLRKKLAKHHINSHRSTILVRLMREHMSEELFRELASTANRINDQEDNL